MADRLLRLARHANLLPEQERRQAGTMASWRSTWVTN